MPPKKGYVKRRRKMVLYKRPRFTPRRYTSYRNRNMSKATSLKINTTTVVPDTMYVRMKYREILIEGGIFNTHTYSLNSIFDPNQSGAGHQPLGHDQWGALYENYQVLASSIKVEFVQNSASVPAGCVVFPSNVSTTSTNLLNAGEQSYAKYRNLQVNTGGRPIIIKNYMSVRKLEARSTDSVNFSAGFGADPVAERFWHVVIGALDSASTASVITDVTIIYYCKLFRKIQLLQS